MLHIALFALTFAQGVIAQESNKTLNQILSRSGDIPIELDSSTQHSLQAYFDQLFEDVRRPDEAAAKSPRVVLVRPRSDALAYVYADEPGYLFWSAEFFLESPSMDIDLYVMAHEMTHRQSDNIQLSRKRDRETHADAEGIVNRIFRVGQRDTETGQPRAAIVHVPTLIEWFDQRRGRQYDYIAPGVIVSALKVGFAKERMTRHFPESLTPRPAVMNQTIAEVGAALERTKKPSKAAREPEKVDAEAEATKDRLSKDPVALILKLQEFLQSRLVPEEKKKEAGETLIALVRVLTLHHRDQARDPKEKVRDFDAFARVSPELFRKYGDFFADAIEQIGFGELPSAFTRRGDRGQSLDWVHRFWLNHSEGIEAGLERALVNRPLDFTNEDVFMGASRLMHHFTPTLSQVELSDHPLTCLYFAGVAGAVRRWTPHGVNYPMTLQNFEDGLEPALGRADGGRLLSNSLLRLLYAFDNPKNELITNVISLLRRVDLDRDFPGFRKAFLADLPAGPRYARLKFAVGGEGDDRAFLAKTAESSPVEYLRLVSDIAETDYSYFVDLDLKNGFVAFLEARIARKEFGYVEGLGEAVQAATASISDIDLNSPRELVDFDAKGRKRAEVRRLTSVLTALVAADPNEFLTRMRRDPAKASHVFTLVDWDEALAPRTVPELTTLAREQVRYLKDEGLPYARFARALIERALKETKGHDAIAGEALTFATEVINAASTTTAEGQELLQLLIDRLKTDRTASGLARLREFLESVRILNFVDVNGFCTLYADTIVAEAELKRPFSKLPGPALEALVRGIYEKFDTQIALVVATRLAEAYHADFDLKSTFENTRSVITRRLTNEETSDFFNKMTQTLTRADVEALDRALDQNLPLAPRLRRIMQWVMMENDVPVFGRTVEPELRARYLSMRPSIRADVFTRRIFDLHHDRKALARRGGEKVPEGNDSIDWQRLLDGHAEYQLLEKNSTAELIHREPARHLGGAIDQLHLWTDVVHSFSQGEVLGLLDTLRHGDPLPDALRNELQYRLLRAKIVVPAKAVEGYVTARFRQLPPLYRAGVVQLLLDGAGRLIENEHFRAHVFRDLLEKLPDAATRASFLDIWEAGLAALPATLRSLVLSIVLSESGRIGSPERALVTLLSHLGPLEQKFGQVLAFADLPETYRTELRELWDGAQKLTWFQAWELILVQKGDIRKAGWRMSRILNSGSTVAYLEIENVQTGERLVVSVFRDGVDRAVAVGTEQLKIFARELVRRDPKRYGFLPLLVEDAVRTMTNELDPGYKARQTVAMAAAYRRAAERLGHRIDADGVIHAGEFRFDTIHARTIELPDGKTVAAQTLARGIPMRKFKTKDPGRHRRLTEALLRLENEVLNDAEAPIDKDRMPGQNIFDEETSINYILDHGQAAHVRADVHAAIRSFDGSAFVGDVASLDRTVERLTGFDVRRISTDLKGSAVSTRPLTYLSAISGPFLAMDEGDERRTIFFELLHGVRAHLRLLQWDEDEGGGVLGAGVKRDVIANARKSDLLRTWVSGVLSRTRLNLSRAGVTVMPMSEVLGARRMEQAYVKDVAGVAQATADCDSLLANVAGGPPPTQKP